MPTLLELRTTVSEILQDPSPEFSDANIDKKLNQALSYVASRVLLPELETTGTVTTDPSRKAVDIPTSWNFSRGLYYCTEDHEKAIQIAYSMDEALAKYPKFETYFPDVGEVVMVVLKGTKFCYYHSPAVATDLTCMFYRSPTALVETTDIPTCLPAALHEELLVNFTLWKFFNRIEDGTEGIKRNTEYYRSEFENALVELEILVQHGQSRPAVNRNREIY